MTDHSKYTEDLPGVEYITLEEEILVEPGDIVITQKASPDEIIDVINHLSSLINKN